jgi:hypothetical protein
MHFINKMMKKPLFGEIYLMNSWVRGPINKLFAFFNAYSIFSYYKVTTCSNPCILPLQPFFPKIDRIFHNCVAKVL